MDHTQKVSRKDAISLLKDLAEEAAKELENAAGEGRKPAVWAVNLEYELSRLNLDLPKRCPGEAHTNPNIDSCGLCTPRWGWIFTGKGYRVT